jgi:hypothetical protein
MSYGKYAILTDVEHVFEKEPDFTWTIKPVTMAAELAIAQFVARDRFVVFPDGARASRPITTQEISMREIALTFRSTNLKTANGNPILPDDATVDQVEAELLDMPPAMVLEIWKAVGEACPPWGPALSDKAKSKNAK